MRAIAFVGDQQSFNKPVEVALDADHRVRVLGFITREELQSLGLAAFAPAAPESAGAAGVLDILFRFAGFSLK